MSVLTSDVTIYGSANMPTSDSGTTGGAVAFSTIVNLNDITPTGTVSYVSSSASDAATTITVYGRDSTGAHGAGGGDSSYTNPMGGGAAMGGGGGGGPNAGASTPGFPGGGAGALGGASGAGAAGAAGYIVIDY